MGVDREKVIKGLECLTQMTSCIGCPYWDSGKTREECLSHIGKDAISLLKEMEVPKWRLCSEELPETDDEVLITYSVFGNQKKRFVETARYCDDIDGEGHWNSVWDEYRIASAEKEVIAWMPLPKPYREGR